MFTRNGQTLGSIKVEPSGSGKKGKAPAEEPETTPPAPVDETPTTPPATQEATTPAPTPEVKQEPVKATPAKAAAPAAKKG